MYRISCWSVQHANKMKIINWLLMCCGVAAHNKIKVHQKALREYWKRQLTSQPTSSNGKVMILVIRMLTLIRWKGLKICIPAVVVKGYLIACNMPLHDAAWIELAGDPSLAFRASSDLVSLRWDFTHAREKEAADQSGEWLKQEVENEEEIRNVKESLTSDLKHDDIPWDSSQITLSEKFFSAFLSKRKMKFNKNYLKIICRKEP